MSFLFKVQLSYDQFIGEAQKFKIPLKFYTLGISLITMYLLVPVGSSGLMYVYFCETSGEKEALTKVVGELKQLDFIEAESLELPLP